MPNPQNFSRLILPIRGAHRIFAGVNVRSGTDGQVQLFALAIEERLGDELYRGESVAGESVDTSKVAVTTSFTHKSSGD